MLDVEVGDELAFAFAPPGSLEVAAAWRAVGEERGLNMNNPNAVVLVKLSHHVRRRGLVNDLLKRATVFHREPGEVMTKLGFDH